jgi:hypothetical protein
MKFAIHFGRADASLYHFLRVMPIHISSPTITADIKKLAAAAKSMGGMLFLPEKKTRLKSYGIGG